MAGGFPGGPASVPQTESAGAGSLRAGADACADTAQPECLQVLAAGPLAQQVTYGPSADLVWQVIWARREGRESVVGAQRRGWVLLPGAGVGRGEEALSRALEGAEGRTGGARVLLSEGTAQAKGQKLQLLGCEQLH